MGFFNFSKFSKFLSACFSFSILFPGFQTHSMDSLNSSFATASGENVDEAFDMFDNIVIPEVCEICKKNAPFYILTSEEIGRSHASPPLICCRDLACVRRSLLLCFKNFKNFKYADQSDVDVSKIISQFQNHENSSEFYVLHCLSKECGIYFVSSELLCPGCKSQSSCTDIEFTVRLFNNEDNIKYYKLFKFLLNKINGTLNNKIFYFSESEPFSYSLDETDLALILASLMVEKPYKELKEEYQSLVNGRFEGCQTIKNQVVGGKLEKYVLLIIQDMDGNRKIVYCKSSDLYKVFSDFSKAGYNLFYGSSLSLGGFGMHSYMQSALIESGLLEHEHVLPK
ncbi:MAG: hypothetical protein J6P21_04085 [Clostridia bacterium]|nr:hypothetical protein [Clostridia bacterium]